MTQSEAFHLPAVIHSPLTGLPCETQSRMSADVWRWLRFQLITAVHTCPRDTLPQKKEQFALCSYFWQWDEGGEDSWKRSELPLSAAIMMWILGFCDILMYQCVQRKNEYVKTEDVRPPSPTFSPLIASSDVTNPTVFQVQCTACAAVWRCGSGADPASDWTRPRQTNPARRQGQKQSRQGATEDFWCPWGLFRSCCPAGCPQSPGGMSCLHSVVEEQWL